MKGIQMKAKVVSIVGPTAVGKTELSIKLAQQFDAEIISGDSMQVYQGLDIGTAKITQEETEGIPHYMIDIKAAHEDFSVAEYQQYIQSYIEQIAENNKLPLLVGGSGLYIQAALYNYHFTDRKRDEQYTQKLEDLVKQEGIEPLYRQLKKIDSDQANKIHPNNHRRVIRALEIYETTGKTMTEHLHEQIQESPYDVKFIGLDMERKMLYERINNRVDEMMEQGLLLEVKDLYDKGFENCQSMRAIGYKEFIPYFKGIQSLDRSIELLKRNSRRYAKRQFTWFKNRLPVQWYQITTTNKMEQYENIMRDVAGFLK